jgi:hypothetical protein
MLGASEEHFEKRRQCVCVSKNIANPFIDCSKVAWKLMKKLVLVYKARLGHTSLRFLNFMTQVMALPPGL